MYDAYATVADVRARYDNAFIDRIIWDDDAEVADEMKMTRALEDATSEIDSYLTAKYSVPLDPVPHLVMRMCVDIAMYHTAVTAAKMTEQLGERYKGWVAHLLNIAKGVLGLGIRTTQTPAGETPATQPPVGTGAAGAISGMTIRT